MYEDFALQITDAEFKLFQTLVYNLIGVNLTEQKRMLVISRLTGRIKTLNLNSFKDYLSYIDTNGSDELTIFVNKITTNETSFFRETYHFDYLKENVFKKLVSENKKMTFRIWSSACSSGEEPYSIAMTARSLLPATTVKILASDINTEVLNKAKKGEYSSDVVKKSVPLNYINRFFDKKDEGSFLIKEEIKKMVCFSKINLIGYSYPIGEPLDIIFCRNVMIYFDNKIRLYILDKFYEYMKKDAILFVGHSENIMSITNKFKLIGKTIYTKI